MTSTPGSVLNSNFLLLQSLEGSDDDSGMSLPAGWMTWLESLPFIFGSGYALAVGRYLGNGLGEMSAFYLLASQII